MNRNLRNIDQKEPLIRALIEQDSSNSHDDRWEKAPIAERLNSGESLISNNKGEPVGNRLKYSTKSENRDSLFAPSPPRSRRSTNSDLTIDKALPKGKEKGDEINSAELASSDSPLSPLQRRGTTNKHFTARPPAKSAAPVAAETDTTAAVETAAGDLEAVATVEEVTPVEEAAVTYSDKVRPRGEI